MFVFCEFNCAYNITHSIHGIMSNKGNYSVHGPERIIDFSNKISSKVSSHFLRDNIVHITQVEWIMAIQCSGLLSNR